MAKRTKATSGPGRRAVAFLARTAMAARSSAEPTSIAAGATTGLPSLMELPAGAEEPLGVDGGHAARASGSDGLAVDRIGRVAGGEDAVDAGARGARLHLEIADRVHLELPLEELR